MVWRFGVMEEKKISSAVIRRLPRYYRYLGELIESGVQRISSKELSARMILITLEDLDSRDMAIMFSICMKRLERFLA